MIVRSQLFTFASGGRERAALPSALIAGGVEVRVVGITVCAFGAIFPAHERAVTASEATPNVCTPPTVPFTRTVPPVATVPAQVVAETDAVRSTTLLRASWNRHDVRTIVAPPTVGVAVQVAVWPRSTPPQLTAMSAASGVYDTR